MPIPTWSSGQILTASDVNSYFVPGAAYKTADTSRSFSATLTADPDLALPVAATAFYQFFCVLNFEGSSTVSQGLKWNFTVPSGTTLRYHATFTDSSNNQVTGNMYTGASTPAGGTNGAGVLRGVTMNGTVYTGSTAGTMTLQWCQNVSESATVTLHLQSYLYLQRIG